jgi:two-component system, NarL family, nitrate/nitrite response regulator NarL
MGRSCLIVDDNEDFLASASRLLRSQGLEVVDCASSGEQALKLAEKHRPDIVLVDVELGDEDGVVVAEQVRERSPSSSVILISAYDREELAELVGPASNRFLPKNRLSAAAIGKLAG